MKDPRARAIMARIAADYDRLARYDADDREAMLHRIAAGYAQLTDLDNGNVLE